MSSPGQHRSRPLARETASEQATAGPAKNLSPSPSSYAAGVDQAIENAATDWWTSGALLACQQLAILGRGFTVDHVLDMVGQPEDFHYIGAVMALAQRKGLIEPVGCRVGAGGRLVRIWWGRAE